MKRLVGILIMLAIYFPIYVYAGEEQASEEVKIYFDQSSSAVNLDLSTNRESITQLTDLIDSLNRDTLSTITRVEIDSYTSPEGGSSYNIKLSERRANSMYEYLKSAVSLPDSIIVKRHSGIDWEGLRERVEGSTMKYKDEVLHILSDVPEETWGRVKPTDKWLTLTDSRIKHLMDLRGGIPYLYIHNNFFSQLRRGSVVMVYFVVKRPKIVEEEVVVEVEEAKEELIDVVALPEQPQLSLEPQVESKRIFAIKSNLLQLVVGVVNVGVECGVGDKFSIDLPITYSPYTIRQNWRIRTLMVQPEFRSWLSEPFTGHFVGAHIHMGYFNVSTDNQDRYQNSAEHPLWGFGVSYGYALNLCKRLNLEFSLGLGYANINYDAYYNIDNGARYETGQQRDYWGLTRAGVSLVYMFNLKK